MKASRESGSHVLLLALALVVLAVIGFAGYRVWQMQQAAAPSAETTAVTVPDKITNTASLNQAATVLDQSSTQVSSNLDDGGLDADLSGLL